MLNVFVSSTYEDLKEFREEACAFVRALHLNHIAMEHWPARPVPPVDAVKAKMGESHVYVGIVAFRYGSLIPEGPKKSYVEYEYELAGERDLPRLMFLVDSRAQWSMELADEDRGLVQTFRRALEHGPVTVRTFKDMNDFRVKFVTSLHSQVQLTEGYRQLDDVRRAMIDIAGMVSRDLTLREAQVASKRPIVAPEHQWFIPEVSRCNLGSRFYISRDEVSRQVSDWLVKRRKPYCFLVGPSGIGKTNFLIEYIRHIIRELGEHEQAPRAQRPIEVDRGVQRVALFLPLGRAYDPTLSLSNCFARYTDENASVPAGQFVTASAKARRPAPIKPETFSELIRSGKALVILDGLDELARTKGESACQELMLTLEKEIDPKTSCVIISCRHHIYRRLQGRVLPEERIERVDVPLLTREELRVAVDDRLEDEPLARHAIMNLPAVFKLARNPLLLDMMCGVRRRSWRQLANEPKSARLYELWFREIIGRTDSYPGAFQQAMDQLGGIAALMLSKRTDVVAVRALQSVGLPMKRLQLLTGKSSGILVQQTEAEWGFVHDSFREFALAQRISGELLSGRIHLLARTDGLDYVGAETFGYLKDLPDRLDLLRRIDSLLRSRPLNGAHWNNLINNCIEMVGMMTGRPSHESERFVLLILGMLDPPTGGRVSSLSVRTRYNLVRCLERLHPTAPRPYFLHVLDKPHPEVPSSHCFCAAAVRGFHRTSPKVAYFPAMQFGDLPVGSPLQERVSACLTALLRQALQEGSQAWELTVNCSFALIRWLHLAHVDELKTLLKSPGMSAQVRGNLFHAFRLQSPDNLCGSSRAFAEMELCWVSLNEDDVPEDFVFRKVRFLEDCKLAIPERRFKDCNR